MPASSPTALLVEDKRQIRRFVRTALEAEGWNVAEADSLNQRLIDARTHKPDLVVPDLGLREGDGIDFIHGLRGWSSIPVIVLSAHADEGDKIAALDAGADDYRTKPFGVSELLARVRAMRRRQMAASADGTTVYRFGDVEVNQPNRVVRKAGAPVHLTPIEYRLLTLLITNAGKVLTHRHLLREVWGPSSVESSHYVRIYVGNLRQKLETAPARPAHIVTETGLGYRFQPDPA